MAWQFLGVSNVVEVTATPHALVTTGISGTLQAGDLLVACISSRIASTTSITLPTGGEWTLVSEQKNNNVLSTGSAASSGLMAYCVRGASNPNLTFTHPVAPSVAIGRIVAYRDVNSASPKDTQTSFTTAISITAVSGAGLTTTTAGDLIVAMAAGGQEAAWSSFNATSPAGASGATSTAAPTTTWLERADSLTTTGVDTSLGIFDAIKTAIGATGNLTATASVAAAHVVIAGAFKITPPTADAWNRDDKSAAITLSNSDKTATLSSAVQAAVRSSTTRANETAGKYYAEFLVVNQPTTVSFRVGIQNNSTALITTTSGSLSIRHDAVVFINSGSSSLDLGANLVTGDVICVAWDAGGERVWFRINNGLWHNDAGADPAAGTGGSDASSSVAAPHSLWFYGSDAAQSVTIRTEAAEFTQTGPSGFTSWMGEALAAPPVIGTGALAGQASAVSGTGTVVTPDAWNYTDKSANITLSNSDKTATLTAAVTSGVRSTKQYLSGTEANKLYAEFVLTNVITGIINRIGIREATELISSHIGSTVWVNNVSGNILSGSDVILGNIGGSPLADGDIVCMAWAPATERIWFRKNNGLWNNNASADPATNTAGLDISFLDNTLHALWFAVISSGNGASTTIRTEAAEFSYAGPSGFVSWMGEALSSVTHYTMPTVVGAIVEAGIATGLRAGRRTTAATGTVAVAGPATGLRRGYSLAASAGAVAVTFNDANFVVTAAKKLTADTGASTVTGYAAALRRTPGLLAAKGTITLAGIDVNLRYRRAYAMPALKGAVTVTFNGASLTGARALAASTGAIVLTGQAAALRHTGVMPLATGAITLTGYPAALSRTGSYTLAASTGAVTLSMQTAALRRVYAMLAAPGGIVVTGRDAEFIYATAEAGYTLNALTGAIVATGQGAGLDVARALPPDTEQPGVLRFGRRVIAIPSRW